MMTWKCFLPLLVILAAVAQKFLGVIGPDTSPNNIIAAASKIFQHPTLADFAAGFGYIAFLAIAGAILPGKVYPGTLLADGKSRINYKCNGLLLFVTLLAASASLSHLGIIDPTIIYRRYCQYFIVANYFALALTFYLYIRAKLLRTGVFTGNVLLDLWTGVELNPKLLGLELKFFWLRPSMMGWTLINLSLAAQQYRTYGALSNAMILYQVFTFLYVLDYFWFEHFMTSTWDIIAEHFGLMLIWGDLVWIPFVFSIQSWYLLDYTPATDLTPLQIAAFTILFVAGYIIFRGANRQKHKFKHDPKRPIWGKPPKLVGGKLLASGWWGLARHMNYTGDIMLAFSYSLPCLFSSWVPYIYPLYLSTLLYHRNWRDEKRCASKYGKVWQDYLKAVPYIYVPYLY